MNHAASRREAVQGRGVIPVANIELWLDDPTLVAGIPQDRDEVAAAGFTDGNYEYDESYALSDWDSALDALPVEQELIAAADASSADGTEFESNLDGDLEDWQSIALQGLETGVATAVLALNAAGCVTTTSCRGHHGRYASSGRDFPRVRFMVDEGRAVIVRSAAEQAGCAFGVEAPIAEVFARTVTAMVTFAAFLIEARPQFELLDQPPHRVARSVDGDDDRW